MVMGRFPGFIILSPFFWRADDSIYLDRLSKAVFKQCFKPFDEGATDHFAPSLQAAYDYQKLRRWRWINATGGLFGKDQSSGHVHGDGGGCG